MPHRLPWITLWRSLWISCRWIVDNLPYCYEQVTHSQLCAPAKPQATYPLFHMAYYYVGYLYKYFSYIIKKREGPKV